MDNIKRIQLKLDITDKEDIIKVLFEDAANLICLYIEQAYIPSSLTFIAEDITVKRFRKLGSEGLYSESIDVISSTFESNPLAEYLPILENWKKNNKKVRLL